MAVSKAVRDLVEAMASRETAKAQQMIEALPDSEKKQYVDYVAAVFAALLDDHFKDGVNRDAIAALVSQIRKDYRNAEQPIKGWTLEGVIRASCGESWIFDELSDNDIVTNQLLVITSLSTEGTVTRPDLYKFLDEGEEIMAEWESEA